MSAEGGFGRHGGRTGSNLRPCGSLLSYPISQVSLFGFGTDQLMRWSHYWDDKYRFESNMHSFKEEQKLILQLQCEGKIVIYS